MRVSISICTCVVIALLLTPVGVAQDPVALDFVGDLNVPSGVPFESLRQPGTVSRPGASSVEARKASGGFGGLSALAFDRETGLLYVLSDSSKATVFVLSFEMDGNTPRWSPQRVLPLADETGVDLPLWSLDPEGIAFTPEGHLLVASEGFVRRAPTVDPGVFRFDLEGRLLERLETPKHFRPRGAGDRAVGVRSNEAFEGLALSPDGSALFVATEGPLVQDQSDCGDDDGCVVRVLEYGRAADSYAVAAEYSYRLEPEEVPEDFGDARRAMGLSEILALEGRRLLVLERGYALAKDGRVHQVIRVFQANLPAAPMTGLPNLQKRLVLDLSTIVGQFGEGFQLLDNYEGMCFGPLLEDGSQTVLMVSDDNYSERQRTSLLVFRLLE